MSLHSLFIISLLALANAQSPVTTSLVPLASHMYPFNQIPYQVSGDNAGPRGPQKGYNLCNATTENDLSLCQTLVVNNLADFCIWSSPIHNDTISNSEQYEVAYCAAPGHGSRLIPPGALKGVQFLYAKSYIQVAGYIDQTMVSLAGSDEGGELDPYGDDLQGNPLGGLAYTNALGLNTAAWVQQFKSGVNTTNANLTQITNWISFIGSNLFCVRLCFNSDTNAPQLCNHIYDEIGCYYNAIADYAAINGTFSVCDSDDMAPPGIFTTDGKLTTWVQPFTPLTTVPYTTQSLASSNCQTFASSELYAAAATAFPSSATASASVTGSGGSGSNTGSAAIPSATGSGAMANGVAISGAIAMFVGVVFGTMITILA